MRVLILFLLAVGSPVLNAQTPSEFILSSCYVFPSFDELLVEAVPPENPTGPWSYQYYYQEKQKVMVIVPQASDERETVHFDRILNQFQVFNLDQGPYREDAVDRIQAQFEQFLRVRRALVCAE